MSCQYSTTELRKGMSITNLYTYSNYFSVKMVSLLIQPYFGNLSYTHPSVASKLVFWINTNWIQSAVERVCSVFLFRISISAWETFVLLLAHMAPRELSWFHGYGKDDRNVARWVFWINRADWEAPEQRNFKKTYLVAFLGTLDEDKIQWSLTSKVLQHIYLCF